MEVSRLQIRPREFKEALEGLGDAPGATQENVGLGMWLALSPQLSLIGPVCGDKAHGLLGPNGHNQS